MTQMFNMEIYGKRNEREEIRNALVCLLVNANKKAKKSAELEILETSSDEKQELLSIADRLMDEKEMFKLFIRWVNLEDFAGITGDGDAYRNYGKVLIFYLKSFNEKIDSVNKMVAVKKRHSDIRAWSIGLGMFSALLCFAFFAAVVVALAIIAPEQAAQCSVGSHSFILDFFGCATCTALGLAIAFLGFSFVGSSIAKVFDGYSELEKELFSTPRPKYVAGSDESPSDKELLDNFEVNCQNRKRYCFAHIHP